MQLGALTFNPNGVIKVGDYTQFSWDHWGLEREAAHLGVTQYLLSLSFLLFGSWLGWVGED